MSVCEFKVTKKKFMDNNDFYLKDNIRTYTYYLVIYSL